MNTRPITTYERQILRAYALGQGVASIAVAHHTSADLILRQLVTLCSFNPYAARAVVIAGQVKEDTPVAEPASTRPIPKRAPAPRRIRTPGGKRRRPEQGEPFTEREQAILDYLAAGEDNTEIAERLRISPHTVKYDLVSVYAKLGVKNRAGAAGAVSHPTDVAAVAGTHTPAFSDREREVLTLLAAGRTSKQIAETLAISVSTVRIHAGRITAKLGVKTRGVAVAEAIRRGLVTPQSPGDAYAVEIRRLAAMAAS